eukprot:m.15221 g.15221  ORF g.15221 m.15221 type:complete len:56 (-) comp10667_c0_seq1:48-215(-)
MYPIQIDPTRAPSNTLSWSTSQPRMVHKRATEVNWDEVDDHDSAMQRTVVSGTDQ